MKEILVISKSFIVREALGLFFRNNFNQYTFKSLNTFKDLDSVDLSNLELLFIDTDEDIIDEIRLTKDLFEDLKIIVFNKNKDKNIFTKCLTNKIDSYIYDIDESDDLLHIVKFVMRRKKYYDFEILDNIISQQNELNRNLYENLTERESEVLKMVGLGYTNKDIGNRLYISEHTVKKHITNILFKLDMKNRKDLIIYTKLDINKEKEYVLTI